MLRGNHTTCFEFPLCGNFSKTHPSSLTLKGGSTLSPKPPFPPGKGDVAGSRYSSRQFFLYRQQAFARKGLPMIAYATKLRFFVAQAFVTQGICLLKYDFLLKHDCFTKHDGVLSFMFFQSLMVRTRCKAFKLATKGTFLL